ncbi:MAG: ATP-dependent DNA helicase RecG [Patescibacteria group bacterium]|nr:MAG: ATP-dependent DNA helicase RecG [Patescibacteria group bacterium]
MSKAFDWCLQGIENLPATSPLTIKRFKSVGVETFWDLLNYAPLRYSDFSLSSSINNLEVGKKASVVGEIINLSQERTRRGFTIQKVVITDGTDNLVLVWFNQSYLLRTFRSGQKISVSGEVKGQLFDRSMVVEEYELLDDKKYLSFRSGDSVDFVHTHKIIPYYSEKKGLSSRVIREKVFYLLSKLDSSLESLPSSIIKKNKLIPLHQAFVNIHYPENFDYYKLARDRLAFDEIFVLNLAGEIYRKEWQEEKKPYKFLATTEIKEKLSEFIDALPFELTPSQRKAVTTIISDMQKDTAMNRFLQGDVGSGKTVVAVIASYFAYLNGYQSLIMAPTEVLAVQHYKSFKQFLDKFSVKIALQTGSIKTVKDYKISISDYDIVIGTHALFNEKLKYEKVGLVVIDEQQRFGVMQRSLLRSKGINPHLLTMTATPIPRTVTLVLFGELNISVLQKPPAGRKPVKTYFVPLDKRQSAYEWIKKRLDAGEQVFIVCPLIEESDHETLKNVRSALAEYEKIKSIFSKYRVGVLHGRMKSKEKQQILTDFKNHNFDILVSTPVIEVGIDIPNATVIVIEGAERYGLAQLHQLRGRVGRSDKQSYCLIFTESRSADVVSRLKYFAKENDGFKLSEYDLRRRGPGEVFGTRQSGFLNVKFASLLDSDLIEKVSVAVRYFVNNYNLNDYEILKKLVSYYDFKLISRD